MGIFDKQTIEARQAKLAKHLSATLKKHEILVIACGHPIVKPGGLDQQYDFLPHPEYFWLTGSQRPEGIMAFSLETGWEHFVKPVSAMELLWEGDVEPVEGTDIAKLERWVTARGHQAEYCLLGQYDVQVLPVVNLVSSQRWVEIQEAINQIRRPKDVAEIKIIKECALAAAKGYELLERIIRPGLSERQLQIEYEAEVFRYGSEKMPYGTIVGAGSNAAILHASPSHRVLKEQEYVLVDAGADIQDYCVDITRVFSTSKKFTTQQQYIYDIVKEAQERAIVACQPGVAWKTIHETAARVMANGLKNLGLMNGDTEELLHVGAIAMFFPHGIGHMVGQRVRDVGGNPLLGETYSCGSRLRVNIDLQEHFLMTVEPGIYFVRSLLTNEDHRKKYAQHINWNEVDKWLDIGGVRLEDDILITANGHENLTGFIPK